MHRKKTAPGRLAASALVVALIMLAGCFPSRAARLKNELRVGERTCITHTYGLSDGVATNCYVKRGDGAVYRVYSNICQSGMCESSERVVKVSD